MQKKIVRREYVEENPALDDLHPLLQQIYTYRGVQSKTDIDRELKGLLPYDTLLNIDSAAARIVQAVQQQQRIAIVGDYDADGATSTALMVSALAAFGAQHIDYIVPNRFEYGYGLSPEIVDVVQAKKPDLIITVDNGIASVTGVARANEFGIDVVVTDHHLAPEELPAAYAIVNPNQPGDDFPSKHVAGVGVAFYVMCAVRSALKEAAWFEQQSIECPNMTQFLDLVALGTVADVVVLDKNNRILVHQGLRRIRAGYARPGIVAMLQIARRDPSRVVASDMGYAIGPRLNAAGRIDDMSLGIACLLAPTFEDGMHKAQQLDQLNQERRALEEQMQQEAFSIIKKLNFERDIPYGFCLFDTHWHQGIVGLVASRMKEKFYRPVIAFAKESADTIKGSARSVKGVHIRDVLDCIATENPGLITKFGGHAMAAGLSIQLKDFDKFSELFNEAVYQQMSAGALEGIAESDGPLSPNDFNLEVATLLRDAGPWGQGFAEPLFDGVFTVLDQRLVGEKHLKMTLEGPGGGFTLDAIAFNVDLDQWPNQRCERVQIAYRLDVNEFRGRTSVQLIVEEIYMATVQKTVGVYNQYV